MKKANIIKLTALSTICISLAGCKSLNQRFFTDSSVYANARELPMPKFPKDSLAPSTRYEIPQIPNTNGEIIAEILPPDY